MGRDRSLYGLTDILSLSSSGSVSVIVDFFLNQFVFSHPRFGHFVIDCSGIGHGSYVLSQPPLVVWVCPCYLLAEVLCWNHPMVNQCLHLQNYVSGIFVSIVLICYCGLVLSIWWLIHSFQFGLCESIDSLSKDDSSLLLLFRHDSFFGRFCSQLILQIPPLPLKI